ncbi:MAG: pentapeptide repeat-containing protein [Aliiglaciecola sp.]|uniref:pentapeptide repeat-containing protein n=1 Tax=Aliiglaciecola sp. TaxID=1872441 RepID=UPI0032996D93
MVNFNQNNEYWSETFTELDLSDEEVSGKEFEGCSFDKCNFSNSAFNRCVFIDCEFTDCNLSNIKIDFSTFSDVSFRDSKLIGIDWTKAAWSELIYNSPVSFHTSILNHSSFYGLCLHDLVLQGCKAISVDFREADFSHANFTFTDLQGSLFDNTNLTAVDFSDATDYHIDIHRNTLKNAKFSRFEAVRLLESLDIQLVD